MEYVYFYARRRAEAQGSWTLTSRQLDYFLRVQGPGGEEPIDHLDVSGECSTRALSLISARYLSS